MREVVADAAGAGHEIVGERAGVGLAVKVCQRPRGDLGEDRRHLPREAERAPCTGLAQKPRLLTNWPVIHCTLSPSLTTKATTRSPLRGGGGSGTPGGILAGRCWSAERFSTSRPE